MVQFSIVVSVLVNAPEDAVDFLERDITAFALEVPSRVFPLIVQPIILLTGPSPSVPSVITLPVAMGLFSMRQSSIVTEQDVSEKDIRVYLLLFSDIVRFPRYEVVISFAAGE